MEQRVFGGEGRFDSICWCTVVASEHADDSASLEGLADRIVELTARTPMPLSIAYRTPDTLGADLPCRGFRRTPFGRLQPTIACIGYRDGSYLRLRRGQSLCRRQYNTRHRFATASFGCIYRRLASRVSPKEAISLWGQTTAEAMRSGAVRASRQNLPTITWRPAIRPLR